MTLNLAASAPTIRTATLVDIELSNGALLLSDGLTVTANIGGTSKTFVPVDPIYGTLDNVSPITEAITTAAPSTTLTILPASPGGVAGLCDPLQQGQAVNVFWCVIDEITGQPAFDPVQVWAGILDTAKLTDNTQIRVVELTITSQFERLFAGSEAQRLNSRFLKSIDPTATGFDLIIEASNSPFWGADAAVPIYAQVPLAPTVGDRIAGNSSGGFTDGLTFANIF